MRRNGWHKGILALLLIFAVGLSGQLQANGDRYPTPEEQNPLILQAFYWEMGTGAYAREYPEEKDLWRLLAQRAPEFADLGFTALWLPPAGKGTGRDDVGYGVYDPWDLGEFDQKGTVRTKYGTKEELLQAIAALHRYGISVYYDAVFNQRLGAEEIEDIPLPGGGTLRAYTRFSGLKGRKKYFDQAAEWEWNWQCFDGIDTDASGRTRGATLFAGKTWDNSMDSDYLLGCDVDYQNERVVAEVIAWGKWLVQEIGVDGFRLDAVKHVDTDFLKRWLAEVQACTDRELFIMAEAWYNDLLSLELYSAQFEGFDIKFIDFPLRRQLALLRDGRLNMASLARAGFVHRRPDQAVTFVDNHDTFRDGLGQPAPIFKRKCQSYAYLLTREGGYPVVFWRDLYNNNLRAEMEKLIRARKHFAYGPGYEGEAADPKVYAYVRAGLAEVPGTGLVLLISSGESGGLSVERINARQPHRGFYDFTGHIKTEVKTDGEGYGDFPVINSADQGWSIWVPKL